MTDTPCWDGLPTPCIGHHYTVEIVRLGDDECRIESTCQRGCPTLDQMQAHVGGSIDTAFRVKSDSRRHVTIDAYCNDEGLLAEGNTVLAYAIMGEDGKVKPVGTFAGNLIFVGADRTDGESVALTDREAEQIATQMRFALWGEVQDGVPVPCFLGLRPEKVEVTNR